MNIGFRYPLLFLASCLFGCAINEQVVRGTPYPTPGAHEVSEVEKREDPITLAASVDTDSIDVKVTNETSCRTVRLIPMTEDDLHERSVSTYEQIALGVGSAALVGAGIAATLSSCPPVTGAANDGMTYNNQCLAKDQSAQKAYNIAGPIMIGTGGLLAAIALINGVRAVDTTKAVPATESQVPSPWETCSTKPIVNALVSLHAGSVTLAAKTNSSGTARFKLTELAASTTEPDSAEISAGGGTITLSLKDAPFYESLTAQRIAQQEAQVRTDAEQEAHVARARALQLLDELEQGLAKIAPPWTEERVRAFGHLLQLVDAIAEIKKAHPDLEIPSGEARVRKIGTRMESLLPGYNRVLDAVKVQRDSVALQTGRAYILQKVSAPSTVKFVSDTVMLECPQGILTQHEFDAQNGFGAVLRWSWQVWQDEKRNRIHHADCTNGMMCASFALSINKSLEERCKIEFP